MALVPPRRRKCGPKVKTGCQTCKIRRVKCDEAKPACRRCTSTGRKCDGYIRDILSSSSVTNQGLVLVQSLSTSIPGSAQEKRSFNYFLNNTGPELSGYYDSSFWEKLLLQAAMAEPSLRHAVIGIGSLHEAFANEQLDNSPGNIDRSFAINQYTKAIGHLRRSLATGAQQPIIALMSCILFVCFDSIRGHFASALVHLHSGLKILRDVKTTSVHDERIVAKSLAPALMRLSIQAILYMDTAHVSDRLAFAIEMTELSERENHIPETFATLENARDIFNQIANGLFRVFYMFHPDLPYSSHMETFPLHAKYSKHLADWNRAYERFMSTNNSILSSKELRGAAMLKIQHTTASIMANVSLPNADDPRPIAEIVSNPEIFKPYISDFETIIKLSKSLIAASEADSRNGKPPLNFSADVGIIGPLYHCCVKCPDHTLRIAAIELLHRCPRREGMWNSNTLVQLVRGFWAIEARHNALQAEMVYDNGEPVALAALLDLAFQDGWKWEWKWKEMASRTTNVVPRYTWAEVLEDRSSASVQGSEKNNQ